jgi:hypothetical protein
MIINIIKITSTKTDFIFYDITAKEIPHYFLDLKKKVISGRYICNSKNVILYDDSKISLINTFEVDDELEFINNKTMLFRKHITLSKNLDNVIKEFSQKIGVVMTGKYENRKEYRKQYYQQNKEFIKQKNEMIENQKRIKQYNKIKYEKDKEKIKEKKKLYYEINKEKKKLYYEQNKEKLKKQSLLLYYNNKINKV